MKTLKKIKKLKEQGLLSEQEYNEIKQSLENKGVWEIKGNSCQVEDYSLPDQGKLTKKEQSLIEKYKEMGIDFTDLVLTWNKIEKK